MGTLFQQALVWAEKGPERADVAVAGGRIREIAPRITPEGFDRIFSFPEYMITPGFVDVHVHLREPGFSYKETIASGTAAAARGGYTAVCAMPNLSPAPDSRAHLEAQFSRIRAEARIRVIPYGCITMGQKGAGELSDLAALAPDVAGFSDDGRGVQDEALMRRAMTEIAALGRILAAHCEDDSLLRGGYIHDGAYAAAHGHRGIPSASEYVQLARDLRLVEETGCRYHVCHVSAKESVTLIRDAKRRGLPVTCETAPHYLLLSDRDLRDEGRFKMNPPIRGRADREALLEALADGTLDMIATDHAPHARSEKAGGLRDSLMGIVGLECAFSLLYTHLVQTGVCSMARLLDLICYNPRRVFGLGGGLRPGEPADLCILNLNTRRVIDPAQFFSLGRSTPFAGWAVSGDVALTMAEGRVVWQSPDAKEAAHA